MRPIQSFTLSIITVRNYAYSSYDFLFNYLQVPTLYRILYICISMHAPRYFMLHKVFTSVTVFANLPHYSPFHHLNCVFRSWFLHHLVKFTDHRHAQCSYSTCWQFRTLFTTRPETTYIIDSWLSPAFSYFLFSDKANALKSNIV